MPELSPQQWDAIRALEWLLDPTDNPTIRGSGRTTALAISAIRKALQHPGTDIQLIDHYGSRDSNRFLSAQIEAFVVTDDALFQAINLSELRTRQRIRAHADARPIYDWLPAHWTRPASPSQREVNFVEAEFPLAPLVGATPVEPQTLWDYLQDPTF